MLLPHFQNTNKFVRVLAGFAIGLSAYFQGRAGACAADAYAETGKGFANYMMVLGMTETVALFVLGFSITAIPKLAGL